MIVWRGLLACHVAVVMVVGAIESRGIINKPPPEDKDKDKEWLEADALTWQASLSWSGDCNGRMWRACRATYKVSNPELNPADKSPKPEPVSAI